MRSPCASLGPSLSFSQNVVLVAGEEIETREKGFLIVISWTLGDIRAHIGSSVLVKGTPPLARLLHGQVPKLQTLKEGNHVNV